MVFMWSELLNFRPHEIQTMDLRFESLQLRNCSRKPLDEKRGKENEGALSITINPSRVKTTKWFDRYLKIYFYYKDSMQAISIYWIVWSLAHESNKKRRFKCRQIFAYKLTRCLFIFYVFFVGANFEFGYYYYFVKFWNFNYQSPNKTKQMKITKGQSDH